jgi:hypothetical protein
MSLQRNVLLYTDKDKDPFVARHLDINVGTSGDQLSITTTIDHNFRGNLKIAANSQALRVKMSSK